MMQDKLLGTRKEFKVGNWIQQSAQSGNQHLKRKTSTNGTPAYKSPHGETATAPTSANYEIMPIRSGAGCCATFITNVGKNTGKYCKDQLDGKLPVLPVGNSSTPTADNPAMTIDWYALEEPWTLAKNTYAASAEGDCIEVAKEAITLINN